MHRRFGVSGVELCDDHHTLLPLLFLALPPVFRKRRVIFNRLSGGVFYPARMSRLHLPVGTRGARRGA
jgi:hypothetical protein